MLYNILEFINQLNNVPMSLHDKTQKPVKVVVVDATKEKQKLNENQSKPKDKGIGSGRNNSWYDH